MNGAATSSFLLTTSARFAFEAMSQDVKEEVLSRLEAVRRGEVPNLEIELGHHKTRITRTENVAILFRQLSREEVLAQGRDENQDGYIIFGLLPT